MYAVVDVTSDSKNEYALKRIRNPHRHERFRREIDAIGRINHPNIIPLLHHSNLDDENSTSAHFLVMPKALGGNLADQARIAAFKGNLDTTLDVAMQLASALEAAHAAGVVHRDVKPENILFKDAGGEVWLSDFGICLIQEQLRLTPDGEWVGARGFIAPECEGQSLQDITPSADIYSLGKVIYFMLSGGIVLPREQLHDPQFAGVFDPGREYRALYSLLSRMICDRQARLNQMQEVMRQLDAISTMGTAGMTSRLNAAALGFIGKIQKSGDDLKQAVEQNQKARDEEERRATELKENVLAWLNLELGNTASDPMLHGSLEAVVQEIPCETDNKKGFSYGERCSLLPIAGVSLNISPYPYNGAAKAYSLQIFLCRDVQTKPRGALGAPQSILRPFEDEKVALLARIYLRVNGVPVPESDGFVSLKRMIGSTQMRINGLDHRLRPVALTVTPMMPELIEGISSFKRFATSEWFSSREVAGQWLTETLEAFFEHVASKEGLSH